VNFPQNPQIPRKTPPANKFYKANEKKKKAHEDSDFSFFPVFLYNCFEQYIFGDLGIFGDSVDYSPSSVRTHSNPITYQGIIEATTPCKTPA